MAISLKDQLLKAGVANAKQARQADHARRLAAKGHVDGESASAAVQKARAEQAERDRAANLARQAEQAAKALGAQVRQLIEAHRIARGGGDVAWQYTDGRKIRKMLVSPAQQYQLTQGQVAIVRLEAPGEEPRHELVPAVVAERIRQRLPEAVVLLNTRQVVQATDEDDPYKDYPIPDDLMW